MRIVLVFDSAAFSNAQHDREKLIVKVTLVFKSKGTYLLLLHHWQHIWQYHFKVDSFDSFNQIL